MKPANRLPADPYDDGWPDAHLNSFQCWDLAMTELRARLLATTKRCTRCNTRKDHAAFNKRSDSGTRYSWCQSCHAQYKRERRNAG